MIDMKAWETGLGTQPTASPVAGMNPLDTPPPATTQASGIPDQYQGWNPGAQYQITPAQWAEWGGGDDWQSGWYRKPSDPMHVVYNQEYGYQDWPTAYGGGALTPNWDISGYASDPERDKQNYPEFANQGQNAQTQWGQGGQQSPWGGWQDLFSQYFGGGQGGSSWGQQPQQQYNPWGQVGPGGTQPQGAYDQANPSAPQAQTQGGFGGGAGAGTYGGDPQSWGPDNQQIGGGMDPQSGGQGYPFGGGAAAGILGGDPSTWSPSGGQPQSGGGGEFSGGAGAGTYGGRTSGLGTYDWRGPLDTAGDTLGRFAEGVPYQSPWQWGQASETASQFAKDGSPVGYQPWWDAQQPILQRTIEDQSKQAAEQAGLSGSRWGTPLQRNITDISGRETANTFGNFMGMSLQGEEMAKQRQQQAVNQLQSLGQGNVGLENMMRQQQMQAAGMLPGLSQTGYGIQSNIANALMQGGMGQQGMNQQALGNLLNIWGQQNPSLAMLLQSGIGGLGTPSNWAQQQYSPSGFNQFMDNITPW